MDQITKQLLLSAAIRSDHPSVIKQLEQLAMIVKMIHPEEFAIYKGELDGITDWTIPVLIHNLTADELAILCFINKTFYERIQTHVTKRRYAIICDDIANIKHSYSEHRINRAEQQVKEKLVELWRLGYIVFE